MPKYKIYALNYAGRLKSSGAFLMWLKDWDKEAERSFYFWCLKSPKETVIVDSGVSPALAAEKGMPAYVNPVELLARIDVRAEEVKHLVLTHIHWDHAGGLNLFPRAQVYVQEDELGFWLHNPLSGRPPFSFFSNESVLAELRALDKADRLILTHGDREILPGIECLLAPGHSKALQAVAVDTDNGTAILGSDAAHVFRNYQEDWPSALCIDLVAWMQTYDKLRARVSLPQLLFPGHDPAMTDNYTRVAPGVTQLV